MALVPHKITALAESDAQGTDGKNIVSGAIVSLYDADGEAAILYDDENGSNGSTAKQTDATGQVVVYVEQGEYDEEVNGSVKRRILVGGKSNGIISYGTTAEIEALRPQRTGSRIENRERANAQYVLADSGYTAQAGDITASNGRVWELQIDGQALSGWFESLSDAVSRVRDIRCTQDCILPGGLSVNCTESSFSLDLGGYEIKSENGSVISAFGSLLYEGGVLGHTTNTITLEPNANLISYLNANIAERPVIKIVSDDAIDENESPDERRGEFIRVASISGNVITLESSLYFSYTTSPRVAALVSESFTLKNGSLDIGDAVSNSNALVFITNLIAPLVKKIKIRRGNGAGVVFRSCYHATIKNSDIRNLTNDPSSGIFGYGVDDSSSHSTLVDSCFFSNTRHAYTTNTSNEVAGGDMSKFGPTMYSKIRDCYCTANDDDAFDTHPNAYFITFENVKGYKNPKGLVKDRAKFTTVSAESYGDSFGIRTSERSDNMTIKSFVSEGTQRPFFLDAAFESSVKVLSANLSVPNVDECIRLTNTLLSGSINVKYSGNSDFSRVFGLNKSTLDLQNLRVDLTDCTSPNIRVLEFRSGANNIVKIENLNVEDVEGQNNISYVKNTEGSDTNQAKVNKIQASRHRPLSFDVLSNKSYSISRWPDGSSASFYKQISSNNQFINELVYNGEEKIKMTVAVAGGNKSLFPLRDGLFIGQSLQICVFKSSTNSLLIGNGESFNTDLIAGTTKTLAPSECINLIWGGSGWQEVA